MKRSLKVVSVIVSIALMGSMLSGCNAVMEGMKKQTEITTGVKAESSGEASLEDSEVSPKASAESEDKGSAESVGSAEGSLAEGSVIEESEEESKEPQTTDPEEGWHDLYVNLRECAASEDRATFGTFFTDRDQNPDYVNVQYIMIRDNVNAGFDTFETRVVVDDGTYYYALAESYHYKEETREFKGQCFDMPIVYVDGQWMVSCGEYNDSLKAKIKELFPEEYREAENADRNALEFGEKTWIDERIILEGLIEADDGVAWQNEDGSLNILLRVKNGTENNLKIVGMRITLTDRSLGKIIDGYETNLPEVIPAHSTQTFVLTVSKESVLTGTAKWTTINGEFGFSPLVVGE